MRASELIRALEKYGIDNEVIFREQHSDGYFCDMNIAVAEMPEGIALFAIAPVEEQNESQPVNI